MIAKYPLYIFLFLSSLTSPLAAFKGQGDLTLLDIITPTPAKKYSSFDEYLASPFPKDTYVVLIDKAKLTMPFSWINIDPRKMDDINTNTESSLGNPTGQNEVIFAANAYTPGKIKPTLSFRLSLRKKTSSTQDEISKLNSIQLLEIERQTRVSFEKILPILRITRLESLSVKKVKIEAKHALLTKKTYFREDRKINDLLYILPLTDKRYKIDFTWDDEYNTKHESEIDSFMNSLHLDDAQ